MDGGGNEAVKRKIVPTLVDLCLTDVYRVNSFSTERITCLRVSGACKKARGGIWPGKKAAGVAL